MSATPDRCARGTEPPFPGPPEHLPEVPEPASPTGLQPGAFLAKAKEGTDYIVVKRPKMKTTPTVLKSLKQNGTMKTFSQFVAETEGEALYEMANLFPKHTGLPFVVWMSYKGGAQHDVRVKVSPGPKAIPSEMVSVAIRPNVQVVEGKMDASDLAVLKKWIELNHDVLLKYWEGEIDTKDALDAIRQIKK